MSDGRLDGKDARVFEPARLEDCMTAEQLRFLANALLMVIEHGYGQVTVKINNGHVRTLTITKSHVLAKTE